MPEEYHSLEPWEQMKAAKKALGLTGLQHIFQCGHGQLNKYARNPLYTSDSARTPVERLRIMLHDLDEAGAKGLAYAMLDFMAEPLDMHVVPINHETPDKDDIREECLDDYPELTLLHDLIRKGADLRVVEAQSCKLKLEIDETVEKYRLDLGE
ncbi:MAG: hypothetical protein ACNI27_08565 [Desulfovibrio sp.]